MSSLPAGFVYLSDIDPTIQQYSLYYNTGSFVGSRVDGYKASKIIVTEKAALALKGVQNDIKKDNYSLLVYDGFRPQKAVDHFIRWSEDESDQKVKDYFYPNIDKRDVFQLTYLAKRSPHTRGSTVDLTIIELGKMHKANSKPIKRRLTDGRSIYYWDDNTVDMYTPAHLFDLSSWHDTDLIEAHYTKNRNYLRQIMMAHKFEPVKHEWWHYSLIDEPFTDTFFNFNVE